MTNIRLQTIAGIKEGDVFTLTRTFTEKDMSNFANITKDYNPVHFDDRFASAKKFDARICHGLLVGSIITEFGGQIGWLATGMDFRFKKPVYFGDTITCQCTLTSIDEKGWAIADAVYKNQNNDTVLEAVLSGILPDVVERDILAQMVAEGDPTNAIKH